MAVRLLSRVALGPDAVGYKFKIARQPEDEEIYEAGLQLERSLFKKVPEETREVGNPESPSPDR